MNNFKNTITTIVSYAVLIFSVVVVVYPLLWILSTSLKPTVEIFSKPLHWIPNSFFMENYRQVFTESTIPRSFLNSIIVSFTSAIIALVFGGLLGYGLARFKFRGKNFLSLFVLMSQMIPITVMMLPFYYIMNNIGLVDSKFGIALCHLSISLPMVTWMIKGYVAGVPLSIEEAATIDGCTQPQLFTRILIPIMKPAIATTSVYAVICSWNEYAIANVLSRTTGSKTLPLSLSEFSTYFEVNWGQTMAAAVVISIPVVAVYMQIQKQFVSGVTSGAVKQ
ncbi:MAG: carbohydrate ABC transporter permease [Clostridia bacterium]|jgi:ABC-type glycerol-3-phosphate transport system permease component|nr:carbohydrate ABC transporter permease [Clostridia bacterium]